MSLYTRPRSILISRLIIQQAAVTFGDPLSTAKFSNIDASRTKVFCATGDAVCQGQFSISAAHLSYGSTDIKPAVAFIQTALGNI